MQVTFQQVAEKRRRNVVRDVGNHQIARRFHQVARIHPENISLDQTNILVRRDNRFQSREKRLIQLNGSDAMGCQRQMAGQIAQAGTDFQNIIGRCNVRRGDDNL